MRVKEVLISAFVVVCLTPVPLLSQPRLLILAPDEFIDDLQPLKSFKEAHGMPTSLLGLEAVYAAFDGDDEPEKVKKCIAHYESDENVRYVMLVGDCDKFPVRYCKAYLAHS